MGPTKQKAEWRFASIMPGVPSVTMDLQRRKPWLCVDNWDDCRQMVRSNHACILVLFYMMQISDTKSLTSMRTCNHAV